jgi:RHS repeat-associated protein
MTDGTTRASPPVVESRCRARHRCGSFDASSKRTAVNVYDASADLAAGRRVCPVGSAIGYSRRGDRVGLDYFGARYFSSAQGRFTSPDWSDKPQPIPYADLKDPQTLNLYSYVRNNPLSRSDPDGHADCGGEKNKSWLFCLGNALGLNQTQTQKVEEAKTYFEYNPRYDAQGHLIDPTKLSNDDVLKVFGTVNQQLRDQVLANAIATAGDRAVGV